MVPLHCIALNYSISVAHFRSSQIKRVKSLCEISISEKPRWECQE